MITPNSCNTEPELPGCVGPQQVTVADRKQAAQPLSTAWISDELLAETIEVWSEAYDRAVSENEAVEILMNVRQFGTVVVNAIQEMRRK